MKMEKQCTCLITNEEIKSVVNHLVKEVIEKLIKPDRLQRDLLIALLLTIMKDNDFMLLKGIGRAPISITDYILSNKDKDLGIYESVFVLKTFQDIPMKMIACPLNDTILINATIPEMYKETYSLCLNTSRYIVHSQLGIPANFSNLDELFVSFKDNIVTPIKSSILKYYQRPGSNLSGMPEEVLINVIIKLDVKDVLNLSKSCKRIHRIVNTESVWSHLYERDFPDNRKTEGRDCYETYKEVYRLKQEAKFHITGNVGVESFQEFAELSDYMRDVSDSRWEVIL